MMLPGFWPCGLKNRPFTYKISKNGVYAITQKLISFHTLFYIYSYILFQTSSLLQIKFIDLFLHIFLWGQNVLVLTFSPKMVLHSYNCILCSLPLLYAYMSLFLSDLFLSYLLFTKKIGDICVHTTQMGGCTLVSSYTLLVAAQ